MISMTNKEETLDFVHNNSALYNREAIKGDENAKQVVDAIDGMLALGETKETWTNLITAVDNYKQNKAAKQIVAARATEGT